MSRQSKGHPENVDPTEAQMERVVFKREKRYFL